MHQIPYKGSTNEWNNQRLCIFFGFSFISLRNIKSFSFFFYICERHGLSQIAQITQRNTASCIISQRKTVWSQCRFGVSSASSARSAGDIGISFGAIQIEYSCVLFSRRQRRSRRGIQQAVLFRRERQLVANFVLWLLLLVSFAQSVFCLRKSAGEYSRKNTQSIIKETPCISRRSR